ncbi:MAG TPA: winged helix-turn-helix domain-containing protein [Candidatus Acidoferrum sp.]|nr:winged helix-turn-helix domain-containing protein [Candidatus Acidoferrum sp.]
MSIYEFGTFRLDVERLLLFHRSEAVPLGPKVVETLLALVEHPGEVLPKNALIERIWPEGYVEEANLAQNIYVLRKTLRALASLDAIETVPRRGYRFSLPVRQAERAPAVVAPLRRSRWAAAIAGVATFAVLCSVVLVTFAATHRSSGAGLSSDGARLYEIGRYYWNLRTRAGVERSLDYFAQVIRTDPRDARGYAALADANAIMGDYQYGSQTPRVYFSRARSYARLALTLDPNSAEAHAALGLIDMDARQLTSAVTELQRAIALDPAYGPAHEWYGVALMQQGDVRAAFAQLQIAGDLDPLSVSTSAWLGNAAYLDRHFNEAIAYSRQALDLSPQRPDALSTLGEAYEAEGNFSRAIEAYKQYAMVCESDCPAESAALLAHAYAGQHRMPAARAQLAFAMLHARDVKATDLAAAAAAVGDRDVALALLRRMHDHMAWMSVENDTRFDVLRGDAGFRELSQAT